VFVYLVWALNFECLDAEHSYFGCRYIFGISRSNIYTGIMVIKSRSRSQEQKACVCLFFVYK